MTISSRPPRRRRSQVFAPSPEAHLTGPGQSTGGDTRVTFARSRFPGTPVKGEAMIKPAIPLTPRALFVLALLIILGFLGNSGASRYFLGLILF